MVVIGEEKTFENRVKKFLEGEGCYFVKFFANAYTKSGIPDILVCCNGRFVGVEVKASKGRPSELQKRNRNLIQEAGGICVILYPDQFDLFESMIQQLKENHLRVAHALQNLINRRGDVNAGQSQQD